MGFLRSLIERLFSPANPVANPVAQPGFAVIDLETTGLSPERHRILEIAIIQTDARGKRLSEWTTRVNPEVPVGATHIHGITEADVAQAPTFAQIAGIVASIIAGRALVAHNARFDLAFLKNEFARAGWDWPNAPHMCTMQSARKVLPQQPRYTLQACCSTVGVRVSGAHSALGDARATAELLRKLLNPRLQGKKLAEQQQLPQQAALVQWPSKPSREPVKPAPSSSHSTTKRDFAKASKKDMAPLLSQVNATEVLAHIPTVSEYSANYIEVLLQALSDSRIDETEAGTLKELQEANSLSSTDVESIHEAIGSAIADLAVADNIFSKQERDELKLILRLLNIPESQATAFYKNAQIRRYTKLSEGLPPLPNGWKLGEPLRVGDRVTFTGIDDKLRSKLESKARNAGVYIGGSVAKNTTMLVTDSSHQGQKLQKAQELGTRLVTPLQFDQLVKWIQPFQEN